MPGTRYRMTAALEAAQGIAPRLVNVGEHNPRRSHRRGDNARPDDTIADSPCRLVAAAADHGCASQQPGGFRADRAHGRGNLRTLMARGEKISIEIQLAQ